MRFVVFALCCLAWPAVLPAAADPLPDCAALTAPAELADAFDLWSRRGRLHEAGAEVCIERIESAAGGDDDRIASELRWARRRAAVGERAQALAQARAAHERTAPATALRAEADTTLGELLMQDEALTEAQLRLRNALAFETADSARRLRALLALSRTMAFRREAGACTEHADAALALAERAFGADDTFTAMALLAVATCHRLTGDHGASIAAIERALGIERAQVQATNHLLVAQLMLMLAQAHKIAGDFPRAERGYHAALGYLREHPEPVPQQLSGVVHGLANLERDEGRARQSLPRYEEAVALSERVYGVNSMRLSQVLNNYGNALGMADRYEDAVAMYERALAIARSRGDDTDPATLIPVANIALVRLWQQRYDEAETGFRRGIELTRNEAAGGENAALFSHLGLAASLWGRGRHAEAFAEAERAERERQLAVAIALARMSEDGAIRYQEYLRPGLDMVIAIAHDSGDPALVARAWALAIAARGQVTAHVTARLAAARTSAAPALRGAFERWREAGAALAELRLQPAADEAAVHAAEDALAAAERALAAAAPAIAADLHAASLDDVLAHLPSAQAQLVAFASSSTRVAHEYAHPSAAMGTREVYAFVGRPQQPPALHRLLAEDELNALVTRWRRAAGDPASAPAQLQRAGRALRRRVFDPLAIDAGALVFVVPYGDLHQINLAALPDGDGYLLERGLRAHTLNHEHELLRPAAAGAALRVLAVGDPAYTLADADAGADGAADHWRDDAAGDCIGQRWPPLPGSRREVEALAERLPDSAHLTALTGRDASRSRVLDALPGQQLIHFATHGLRRGSNCGGAALASRGAGLAVQASDDDASASSQGVGLLVLAAEAGTDDGARYLSEVDITALDLGAARWVVLSACDTGIGDSRAYEGAFGLRRAFHLAGAGTVIMSLWRVDDAATADWMAALYAARLGEGRDTPAAIHQAQAAMLAARRTAGLSDHPYYWAAFIAAGDWR